MGSVYQDEGRLCTEILRFLLNSCDELCEERVEDVFRRRSKWCAKYGIHNTVLLRDFLEDYPQAFELFDDGGVWNVSPTTELTLCAVHSRKSGSCRDRACTGLHFCIFYLLSGQCAFAVGNTSGCLFGHDLEGDSHNRRLLERSYLGGLNLTEIRRLFCLPAVRRGVTVPKVCKYYNKHMGCNKGGRCRALHLCQPYVLEACKFGLRCKRNHDINHQQVKQVLTLYGVRVEGRPLSDILREVRNFPRDEDRQQEDSCSDDSEDYDDRGRQRQAAQPPVYRRSMSQPGSSARAASRPRHTSTSAQTPSRPVTQRGRESSRSTQQEQDLADLRIRELEAEAARLGVPEQDLEHLESRFPDDYRQHLMDKILFERQQQQQQQQQRLRSFPNAGLGNTASAGDFHQANTPSESNSIYSDFFRMLSTLQSGYEDPADPPSGPLHYQSGRSATEHEMAEDGSGSRSGRGLQTSPRNGTSMPPPPPPEQLLPDSGTLPKTADPGAGAGIHNTRNPGLRNMAPTYRPLQLYPDSTLPKTVGAADNNPNVRNPGLSNTLRNLALTYRPSQLYPNSTTSSKTAGARDNNLNVSSPGPENHATYLRQLLCPESATGDGRESRAGSLSSHNTAMSCLNAAPPLQPDSMVLSAGNQAKLRALQGFGRQPHTREQPLPALIPAQQLEPREIPRAQQQDMMREQQPERLISQQQEALRSQQQEMLRFLQPERLMSQQPERLIPQQQEMPGSQRRELLRAYSSQAETARSQQQEERLRLQREVDRGRQAEFKLRQLTLGHPMVLSESPYLSLANPSQTSASLESSKLQTAPLHALTSERSAQQSVWTQGAGHTTDLLSLLLLDPLNASVDSLPSRNPI